MTAAGHGRERRSLSTTSGRGFKLEALRVEANKLG